MVVGSNDMDKRIAMKLAFVSAQFLIDLNDHHSHLTALVWRMVDDHHSQVSGLCSPGFLLFVHRQEPSQASRGCHGAMPMSRTVNPPFSHKLPILQGSFELLCSVSGTVSAPELGQDGCGICDQMTGWQAEPALNIQCDSVIHCVAAASRLGL